MALKLKSGSMGMKQNLRARKLNSNEIKSTEPLSISHIIGSRSDAKLPAIYCHSSFTNQDIVSDLIEQPNNLH